MLDRFIDAQLPVWNVRALMPHDHAGKLGSWDFSRSDLLRNDGTNGSTAQDAYTKFASGSHAQSPPRSC
ncbi:hypothetical protein AUR04nite_18130 [Glutamicibacter uratoxydans]|uniref:Uncharacterized protein n=1 Tax=Glutamicibacter uratoxydans TaxID=43667 RepID=A0A4Y4DV38_GLUUR|nr:hypothetical protein AUR04nite_18130 [Glutamicibacter uratoxydans]